MHAIWWSAGVIVLNCFFLNHNDFFKLFGASGTPRDMKNYTWVIYVTGVFNLCQSVAVANFGILMGHYNNGWIDQYTTNNYLAKGVPLKQNKVQMTERSEQ